MEELIGRLVGWLVVCLRRGLIVYQWLAVKCKQQQYFKQRKFIFIHHTHSHYHSLNNSKLVETVDEEVKQNSVVRNI